MTRSVWFLVPALSVGGTERTLVDLVNGLDEERFEPTVWTIFEQNPLADELHASVDHRTLGVEGVVPEGEARVARASDPVEYVRAPLRFVRAVREHRPAILQSFLRFDNVMARLAGAVSGRTTVVSGVRSVPKDESRVQVAVDRATMPLADLVVSNSVAGKRHVIERGMPSERVEVIPNGRELEIYRDADVADIRASLGLAEDARLVGTVGRLIERKGHDDLLEAWPRVRSRHPDAHLVLVGDGPRRDQLESKAVALGVADSVHFLGMCEDVPSILAAFDAFAFPSHFEGLPGAVIEAMAAGLPIVATPVDGNRELVEDGETGIFVPVKDPAELACALGRVLEDTALASRLGQNARRDAFERYAVDQMVAAFERLYESVDAG